MSAVTSLHPTDPPALQVLLGRRLRAVRQGSGMTQDELARALTARLGTPISRSTIGNYETGRRPLPADRLLQIAEVCGVPLHAFAQHAAVPPAPPLETTYTPTRPIAAANATSEQARALIDQALRARPDVIPFVLELIAGFVEEPEQR